MLIYNGTLLAYLCSALEHNTMTLKARYKQVNWYENCLKQIGGKKKYFFTVALRGVLIVMGPVRFKVLNYHNHKFTNNPLTVRGLVGFRSLNYHSHGFTNNV